MMGTNYRKITVITKEVVDVSREIVIDAMYMTTDLLHAIRNNLPIELSGAQLVEAVDSEDIPKRASARRGWRILAALAALLLVAGGAFGGHLMYEHQSRAEALDATHAAFWRAIEPIDTNSTAFRAEAAALLDTKGNSDAVLSYLDATRAAGPLTIAEREIYLNNVVAGGDIARSRSLALKLLGDDAGNQLAKDIFTESFMSDPRFGTELTTLSAASVVVGEVDAETMRIQVNVDGRDWVWVPATVESPDRWQTPVAAFRLCLIVGCEFGVSPARPVVMTIEDVSSMFVDDEFLTRFQATSTLEGDVVKGALLQKRLESAKFPVERSRAWRRLLDADKELKHQSAVKALKGWKKRDRKVLKAVAKNLGDTTSADLTRQLSSLMVFDYLAGNYRRFARSRKDYGKNLGVVDGRIWSEQDENVFGVRASKRLKGRIKWVERFSRANILAVQAADFDKLAPLIFPGETQNEGAQARLLAKQAKDLSRRVDGLTTKYGDDILL